jgi:Holliday junction resolvasome RuvABC endonuclease subunit
VNVLGLDLSITAAGFAPDHDGAETVGGPSRDGDGRLVAIRNRVRHWTRARRYDLAVLEGLAFGGTASETLAMVHGVVRAELWQAGIPYALVYPSTLKAFATGDSRATKEDMKQAASGMAGRKFHDDNMADAYLLRRMGCAALGDLAGLTPEQVGWLGRVDWPKPIDPFAGTPDRTQYTHHVAKCRHKVMVLANGDYWLHPFTLDRCDKPPR